MAEKGHDRERGTQAGSDAPLPDFAAPYAPPDEEIAAQLLAQAPRERAAEARIDAARHAPGRGDPGADPAGSAASRTSCANTRSPPRRASP